MSKKSNDPYQGALINVAHEDQNKRRPSKRALAKAAEDQFAAECRHRRMSMDLFHPFNSRPYLPDGSVPNLFSDADYTKCTSDDTVCAAEEVFGAVVVCIMNKGTK